MRTQQVRQMTIIKCQKCDCEDLEYTDRFFIIGNRCTIKCQNCQSSYSIVYGKHYSLHGMKVELGRKFAKLNRQNGQARLLIAEMQRQIRQFEFLNSEW